MRAEGFTTATQEGVVVTAGEDTSVPLKLVAAGARPSTETASSGSKTDVQRVFGWVLVGLGLVSEIVAGVEGIEFLSAKSTLDNERAQVSSQISDVCANTAQAQFNAAATTACQNYNQAADDRSIGIGFGVAGGVALVAGAVMLLTDHHKETGGENGTPTARAKRPRFQVLPYASTRGTGGGLNLAVTF